MIEIKAYIKIFKLDEVILELHRIDGITGASISNVFGFGHRKKKTSGWKPGMDPTEYVKHVKIEIVCDDSIEDIVITAIHKTAHTGLPGDGRIFISNITREVNIGDVPV